jgi:hypothetical protein
VRQPGWGWGGEGRGEQAGCARLPHPCVRHHCCTLGPHAAPTRGARALLLHAQLLQRGAGARGPQPGRGGRGGCRRAQPPLRGRPCRWAAPVTLHSALTEAHSLRFSIFTAHCGRGEGEGGSAGPDCELQQRGQGEAARRRRGAPFLPLRSPAWRPAPPEAAAAAATAFHGACVALWRRRAACRCRPRLWPRSHPACSHPRAAAVLDLPDLSKLALAQAPHRRVAAQTLPLLQHAHCEAKGAAPVPARRARGPGPVDARARRRSGGAHVRTSSGLARRSAPCNPLLTPQKLWGVIACAWGRSPSCVLRERRGRVTGWCHTQTPVTNTLV